KASLYINGVLEDRVSDLYDTWTPWVGISSEFGLGSSLSSTEPHRNFRGLMDAFSVQTIAVEPNGFVLPTLPCAENDINGDCIVDMKDMKVLAEQWLDCTMPGSADCGITKPVHLIPQGTVTVDGSLSEWANAEWIALDKDYLVAQYPEDISEAKFSLKWNPATAKIYSAVIVHDSSMFMADSPGNYDDSDRIEVYSQGDNAGGTAYGAGGSELFDIAQQYLIGSKNNKIDHWAVFANNDPNVGAGYAEFEHAVVVDDVNHTITYEIGVKQYDNYGGISQAPTVVMDMQAGDTVGFDIIADSRFSSDPWDFGMLAENLDTDKFYNASAFAHYTLEGVECGYYGYKQADISGPAGAPDCIVNLYDFAAMASEWMSQ
ncbi:MAG: hypothetical protein ACYC54_15550, partial [Sedimentisphaerales bacterium]